ncbi:MAG: UdgX family uracil-DNA binding protein [Actinomycetota bacterium]|nr:UdgX family uracil-DNA binding protein [Actinomycetota bacterium]
MPAEAHGHSITALRKEARSCTACDLYKDATQTVFGEGPPGAHLILIGEQPGDKEDIEGAPFVGPAGALLDRALDEAGIDRNDVYVTNAVKHFKFIRKGKRRIHQKPNAEQMKACRPWLDAEIAVVKPKVIVCMGATAAQQLLGRTFRLTQHRGEFFAGPNAATLTATIHPSAILRAPDDESRHREMKQFVKDLKLAGRKVTTLRKSG